MDEPEHPAWRMKARMAIAAYFHRRTLTPFTLGFLLALTGFCGFLLSYGLLRAGVDAMAIRYPVAVLGAYGIFLGLLRGWVEWERRRFDPDNAEFQTAVRKTCPPGVLKSGGSRSSSIRWYDWVDLPSNFLADPGDGCLVLLVLAALVALAYLLASYLIGATALIEEGFLDTFLVVGLYRRLRIAAREHWIGTTIRKTWTTVFVIAAALAILGFCLQYSAPEARSIGPAIRHLMHPNP